jgi:hypothetical protein
MQTLSYYLKLIWVWLKGLVNAQTDTDLLWLLINKLITPDIQSLIYELIKEAARLDMSGAEKKKYVMGRIDDLQHQLLSNVYTLKDGVLSTAVNLLVEYMQASGELKRSVPKEVI